MKKNKVMLTKSGETYICKYMLDAADIVDTKVDMGTTGKFPQIIPHTLEEKDGQREFVYQIGQRIPLTEFLKKEFNKEQMLTLLYHVLAGLESFGMNMISLSYVAKDVRYVFVDPETSDVSFVIASVDKGTTDLNEVREMIKEILADASYFEMDRDNYVAKLITFLNRKGTFSINDMKKYVYDMLMRMGIDIEVQKKQPEHAGSGKVSRVGVMQNNAKMQYPQGRPMPVQGQPMPVQGQPMPMQGRPMPMQGQPMPPQGMQVPPQGIQVPPQGRPMPMQRQPMPPQGGMPVPPQGQPMPMQGSPMPMQGQPMPPQGQLVRPVQMGPDGKQVQMPMPPVPPMAQPQEKKDNIPEVKKTPEPAPMPKPMPVPEATPASQVKPMPAPETKPTQQVTPAPTPTPAPQGPRPYLLRVATNEKIYIDKPEFSIGRSATKADYTVTNNSDMSRIHCIIERKHGVSYIKDNQSTNGTFVNGENIAEKENVFLTNRAKVSMGGEEFIYFVS